MALDPNTPSAEAERAELERVVEALARSPRLAKLLQYMGQKYFSGSLDQLNEYNIATEVLGRSKTVFNAAEDAIARVETHRLRKRLAAFYEAEGRDHSLQVTLPPGSYIPVFIPMPTGEPRPAASDQVQAPEPEPSGHNVRPTRWFFSSWRYPAAAAAVLLAALGLYLYLHFGASPKRAAAGGGPAPASVAPPSPASPSDASSLPIRILAGYEGPPRTDSAGRVWSPDRNFSGGGAWPRSPGPLARTANPFIFDHSRTGDFAYNIPLKPGTYELHLFFSTHVRSDEATSFNVSINGERVLVGFSINPDAQGEDIADERVFRGVSPQKDGFLHLLFSGVTGPPVLNAIEILPGPPQAQLPIRLIMQTVPMTDPSGQHWDPDDYYMLGRLNPQSHPLQDSPDPDLFSGERYGHFTYAIPVDTRDKYTVILHFAESYFGSGAPGSGGAGSRVFKVMCNGQTLLDDFDIFKEAGTLHEVTKVFHHIKPSAQGKLNLIFEPVVNNATISGIEVLDESQ